LTPLGDVKLGLSTDTQQIQTRHTAPTPPTEGKKLRPRDRGKEAGVR